MPPGRFQGYQPVPSSSGFPSGFSAEYVPDVYQAAHAGYNNGRGNGFDIAHETDYPNTYSSYHQSGFTANLDGYQQPVMACYAMPGVATEPTPYQPQALQLSSAIPAGQPTLPGAISRSLLPSHPVANTNDADAMIPTKGSLQHGTGRCKPCAFVYTKGCDNGWECPFCHLCDLGEKKKRRKDKLENRRVMRELRHVFALNGPSSHSRGHTSGSFRSTF
jgi:hypothetical protein